jgi:hypothetical protein
MKKFFTLLTAIAVFILVFGNDFKNAEIFKKDIYVYEDFVIDGIYEENGKNIEVHAETLENGAAGGWFFMDKSIENLDDYEVGDIIRVQFSKEDYENEIWDNYKEIEILN